MNNFDEFVNDYNWQQAFMFGAKPDLAPPYSKMDNSGFTIDDIKFIIAYSVGENDAENWIAVVHLKDSRYAMVDAGCDYTGWDCRCWGTSAVAESLADIIRFGMDADKRKRLGLELVD